MGIGTIRPALFLCAILFLASCADLAGRPAPPSPTVPPRAISGPEPSLEPPSTPTVDPGVRRFPETGHALRGGFRRFWEQNGGVETFGLPLTGQVSVDGLVVQYFERARFEARAEGVTLGRLGLEALRAEREPVAAAVPQAGCQFVAETGHNLCPPILGFWENAGGTGLLGNPIEDAREDGDVLRQHFERARIEVPDGKEPHLAAVGAEALARMPGGSLLAAPGLEAAPLRALIVGHTVTLRPFERATVHVQVEDYSGPAELVIADERGPTGRYALEVQSGQAEASVEALGALGAQAAIVLVRGQVAGVAVSALALRAETSIRTGQTHLDRLLPMVKHFMDQSTSDYVFDGHRVHGYRSPDSDLLWLRDHVHQGKGYAYWERDMTSLLDQFRRFQYPDGSFDDYIANKAWGLIRGRIAVEADVEYLFIEGVYRAWQATGDDHWLRRQVEAMERGLQYIRTDPLRWDETHQLVKRPFTVDTWDFEYGPQTISPEGKPAPRHWIDEQTKWSIFHGDNTGYANSMELLARIYSHLGNVERAAHWRGEAEGITVRLNALSWNGRFFRHMVHLTPVEVPGVDEAAQLSLSNAYALNRSGVSEAQAREIIAEYYRRWLGRGEAFSEWYSIDPPFPAGSLSTGPGWGAQPGEYVNGGHMPLVGGELARGAFHHGQEAYGFDILRRYYNLISATGGSYLWYHPIGQPGISGPDSLATDGWGSSAMLAALVEGAVGVSDQSKLFRDATIAPRWSAAADVEEAGVVVRYGASEAYVAYRWQRQPNGLSLRWTGGGERVHLHVLLPPDAPPELQATLDGKSVPATVSQAGSSRYLDLAAGSTGVLVVSW